MQKKINTESYVHLTASLMDLLTRDLPNVTKSHFGGTEALQASDAGGVTQDSAVGDEHGGTDSFASITSHNPSAGDPHAVLLAQSSTAAASRPMPQYQHKYNVQTHTFTNNAVSAIYI